MSVRKRRWIVKSTGEAKEAWIIDYTDQQGDRHVETFRRRKDAEARHDAVRNDVRHGIHVAPNKSLTVAQAADDWLAYVQLEGRERSTVEQYRGHVRLHINPRIGRRKLSELTTPGVNAFRDDLLVNLSRAMARKVLTSLKSLLQDAQRRGNAAQNVAAGVKIGVDKRGKRKLRVGVDIPTPHEITALIAASGGWRPLLLVAAFAGLRASELRGLRWEDVDFKKAELHVRQRADRYRMIGKPKSESGARAIPLRHAVLQALKEWRLACPRSEAGLVFPNGMGRVRDQADLLRALGSVFIAAGLTDKDGKTKYALHALRHFFASWCINSKQDGGLELPPKVVQERLGHSSIVMTMDTYGHLFPRSSDGGELTPVEKSLPA